jgi:hypothetical protein
MTSRDHFQTFIGILSLEKNGGPKAAVWIYTV